MVWKDDQHTKNSRPKSVAWPSALPTLNACFGAASATGVSPRGRPCSMRSSTRRPNPRKPPLPPRCGKSGKRRRNAAPVPARSRRGPNATCMRASRKSGGRNTPQGVNFAEYDIIGQEVTRILHRSPARVWVECVERPVLRKKGEKDIPSPSILQAPAPVPVLGGGHVAADFLAGVLADKFVYHDPRIPPGEDVRGCGGEAFHLHPQ